MSNNYVFIQKAFYRKTPLFFSSVLPYILLCVLPLLIIFPYTLLFDANSPRYFSTPDGGICKIESIYKIDTFFNENSLYASFLNINVSYALNGNTNFGDFNQRCFQSTYNKDDVDAIAVSRDECQTRNNYLEGNTVNCLLHQVNGVWVVIKDTDRSVPFQRTILLNLVVGLVPLIQLFIFGVLGLVMAEVLFLIRKRSMARGINTGQVQERIAQTTQSNAQTSSPQPNQEEVVVFENREGTLVESNEQAMDMFHVENEDQMQQNFRPLSEKYRPFEAAWTLLKLSFAGFLGKNKIVATSLNDSAFVQSYNIIENIYMTHSNVDTSVEMNERLGVFLRNKLHPITLLLASTSRDVQEGLAWYYKPRPAHLFKENIGSVVTYIIIATLLFVAPILIFSFLITFDAFIFFIFALCFAFMIERVVVPFICKLVWTEYFITNSRLVSACRDIWGNYTIQFCFLNELESVILGNSRLGENYANIGIVRKFFDIGTNEEMRSTIPNIFECVQDGRGAQLVIEAEKNQYIQRRRTHDPREQNINLVLALLGRM